MIDKLKSKYKWMTHQYGIRIPKNVKEACMTDKNNGDTMRADTIREKMKKTKGAVCLYDGDPKELIGFQEITCHIIFEVKLGCVMVIK